MQAYIKVLQKIIKHPANKGKQTEALLRALQWQLTAKHKEVTELYLYGYKVLVNNPEVARRLIYYYPYYDFNSMKFMERYLKPGDFFIDIGANIGIYTLLAASLVGNNGHIDSFEAFPTTFKRLKENIERNNIAQVTLHPVATGYQSKIINFTTDLDTRNFVVDGESMTNNNNRNLVQVPCQPIDRVLNHDHNYAMAKIDVEGYELPTLQGAQNCLSNHNPPILLLEMNEAFARYGFSELEIKQYLNQKGYQMAVYDAKKNLLEFTVNKKENPDVLFIAQSYKEVVSKRLSS